MEEKDYMTGGTSLSLMIVILTGGGEGGGGSMTGESMGVAEVISMKGILVAMTMSVRLTCTMHQAPSIKERRNIIGHGFIRMTILRPEVIQMVREEGHKVKEVPLILMVLRTVSAQRGGGRGDGLVAVTVGAGILRREEKDGDIIQKKEKNLGKARNVSSRKSGRQLIKIQLRKDLLKS